MCVVSMVMDHYTDEWSRRWPLNPQPGVPTITVTTTPAISQEELDEFRRLLERAREYDKRNSEPDCELDEKRQALKHIAHELGVEISFL